MLSTRESLQAALRTAKESLVDAVRVAPRWLAFSSLLLLTQALLPGAQVVLLERVVERLADDPCATLLGLTAVVGLMYPLGQVALAATQRMALRLRLRPGIHGYLPNGGHRLAQGRGLRPPRELRHRAAHSAATWDGARGPRIGEEGSRAGSHPARRRD